MPGRRWKRETKICELVGKVTEIEMKREVFRKEVLEETGLGR